MRRIGMIGVLLIFIALAACSTPAADAKSIARSDLARETQPSVAQADVQTLAADNNSFAFDFYSRVRGQDGNLVYSPYSISLAAAMVYPGAAGETASQMASALHFTLAPEVFHPAFNALQLDLDLRPEQAKQADKEANMQLSIANAVWAQKEYTFEQPYLDILAADYGAGIRLVDFIKAPGSAEKQVNAWVNEQTKGKIKDILPKGSVDPSTRMILANAVYFKSAWQEAFAKNLTEDAAFTLLDGTQEQVPMMQTEGAVPVKAGGGEGYQAVALPYKGKLAEMVILVPDAGNFAAFEQSLDEQQFAEILAGMSETRLTLYMPKFEFSSDFDLKPILAEMGMPLAFDDQNADFSNMTKEEQLYIEKALHKAYILTNEEGTEAAAVTIFQMQAMSMPMNELRIDRPFIFVIRDVPTGAILFVGRVVDPLVN